VQHDRRTTSTRQLAVAVVLAYVAETGSVQEVVETPTQMAMVQDKDSSRMTTGRRRRLSVAVTTTQQAQPPGGKHEQDRTEIIRCTLSQSLKFTC